MENSRFKLETVSVKYDEFVLFRSIADSGILKLL